MDLIYWKEKAPATGWSGGTVERGVYPDVEILPQNKRCTKCLEVKPLDSFYPHPRARDGLRGFCIQCGKQRDALYYAKNRERFAERNAIHYRAHKNKHASRNKRWRLANADRVIAVDTEWRRRNRERIASRARRRRAGLATPATETKPTRTLLRIRDGDLCPYCLARMDFCNPRREVSATVDHVVPVRLGGLDTLCNTVLACRLCNTRKGAKPLLFWLAARASWPGS